jgi:hypothetical protein
MVTTGGFQYDIESLGKEWRNKEGRSGNGSLPGVTS